VTKGRRGKNVIRVWVVRKEKRKADDAVGRNWRRADECSARGACRMHIVATVYVKVLQCKG
jgi:hypothetical protein